MSNPKVALYLRVSTADQSLDLQRTELLRFAIARGWKVHNVYEDIGSGASDNRPQFKKLMKDAQSRTFDIVLCWKLDRIARSLRMLLNTIQTLEDYNVPLASFTDGVDLSSSSGRLMMSIIGAFAQFERDIIRGRVNAGLREAKRKGVQLGRPNTIDANKVVALRSKGLSMAEIASELQCSKGAVHKILKSS